TEADFNPTPCVGASFALRSVGEEVYLFSGNTNLQLTGYSHGFKFGGAQEGVTFGRYVNSAGDELFPPQLNPTLGATNLGPRIGPIVINEIHYHPAPGDDEFVELLNITGQAVALFDPARPATTWQFNGLDYSFPTNLTLGPGGLLVLTPADPVAFRAK